MNAMPTIIVTEHYDEDALAWLKTQAVVVEAQPGSTEFSAAAAQAEALCVRTYTKVNDALLAQLPKLRVVARGGVGLENIDQAACAARGVKVLSTPDANTQAVAEIVIGSVQRLVRPWVHIGPGGMSPADFKHARNTLRGKELASLVWGIWGMGRVGRRLGRILSAGYGAKVLYYDLQDVSPHIAFPATRLEPADLLKACDVLSLHVDMRPGNTGLIGKPQLAQMKPGSIVVNTSRGEVLDAAALADSIKSGHTAGAFLDVFHPEPPPADYPLLGLPNVLLTPHVAARTDRAMSAMSWVLKDVMESLAPTRT